ncbi:MAG: FAD-dependent tricarballylate dehydrogenase TcuA [Vicinamibacterales bacterium]
MARDHDVVIAGGGNAALCAALTARAAGARVVVLECAPRHFRGGNSRHTRNLRVAHAAPLDLLPGAYPEDEFLADLLRVSGTTNEALARLVIGRSPALPGWMRGHGVRFQTSQRGRLQLERTNAFFLGGGKALLNAYYAAAERMGVDVLYDAEVEDLEVREGRFASAVVRIGGQAQRIRGRAVVLAAGGFESNTAWLREAWGPAADNFIIRGTPFNTGRVLKVMLEAGAQPVGDPKACHAVAVDARAPRFDGGIVTRLDSVPLGIVVNALGRRFYDEGEDFWPKRYAIWGSLVAQEPGQLAYSIVDDRAMGRFMPSVFPPIEAASIPELARRIDVPADALEATVGEFNRAVRPGAFDHRTLDDCRTEGLVPPKTHWARPIDTPPFRAYPLRPGITFTFLGLTVDERARVIMTNGMPAENVYAAGEIMAGNILRRGYVAGVGMTIGTVFGRIAGEGASRHASG